MPLRRLFMPLLLAALSFVFAGCCGPQRSAEALDPPRGAPGDFFMVVGVFPSAQALEETELQVRVAGKIVEERELRMDDRIPWGSTLHLGACHVALVAARLARDKDGVEYAMHLSPPVLLSANSTTHLEEFVFMPRMGGRVRVKAGSTTKPSGD